MELMNVSGGQAARISAVILLLVTAALVALKGEAWWWTERAPDTPDSATYWYCHQCREGFALTAAEYEKRVFQYLPKGDPMRQDGLVRPELRVKCPRCSAGAVSARRCLTDNEIFDPAETGGVCPKCPK